MSKIVVIGANHAGTAAINTIFGSYPKNEVVVFDQNSVISFLGCGMALWIGKQISGPDGLFYQTPEGFEAKGAKVHMQTRVTSIDYDVKTVHAVGPDGNEWDESYDKLILATGSLPIIPALEGSDLQNIQQVKLFQDAQEVIKKLEDQQIKRVAVVGAGYIGVELTEAFKRTGREVVLIDKEHSCVTNNFDDAFSDRMAQNLRDHGIDCHFSEEVVRFEGSDGKVTHVVTDKGSYAADMVCICVGFKPNTALFVNDGFETLKNGAILVNHQQQTSKPDVYAIGDCSSVFYNAEDGKPSYIALATNAVRSGIVAAHNACGTELAGIGVQGSSALCIYDLKMVATGMPQHIAQAAGYDTRVTDFTDVQKASFVETPNPEVQIRIVYDGKTRKVLGAQMASEYDMTAGIHMFSLAIQEGITIDRLALLDIFFLPHFNQPYNYYTMAALSAK